MDVLGAARAAAALVVVPVAIGGCGDGEHSGLDACVELCEQQSECVDACGGDCQPTPRGGGGFFDEAGCDDACESARESAEQQGCGDEFDNAMICLEGRVDGCSADFSGCEDATVTWASCEASDG